jgi:hypothetical protein
MKKLVKFNVILVVIALMLTGCSSDGGNAVTGENQYLGKIPSLEKSFVEQTNNKQALLEKETNMEKYFEISREIEIIEDEWKNTIKEAFAGGLPSETIPFQAAENTMYTVNKVFVNSASKGHMGLKFDVTINEDIKNKYGNVEGTLMIYFKAVDKNGKEIPNTKTVAVNLGRHKMTAGTNLELSGTWQSKGIVNLGEFDKIIETTKEDYEAK